MSVIISESKAPLSANDLANVERELGVVLPDDYKSFMLQHNGGTTEPDGFAIRWREGQKGADDWKTSTLSRLYYVWNERLSNLVRNNKTTFKDRIPSDTITVGADAGGNQILLVVSGLNKGKVLFWVKDYEASDGDTSGYDNVGVLADSFEEFINHKLF
ncbi:hypothetical protein CYFUS_005702 [Cystobacter fuscus]|uniref:Knr4/Smi1-like domain-containing protein n=1 Tax=Cystobacter fuscus TaxID=43 RepID=A0A250J8N3_9BACT|nr:SMI1/KNR4 family protein [Cystobacter fuscus]ATB40254.1 hypothetical protein CYFUS_005702 [Cystobacter fuscus]